MAAMIASCWRLGRKDKWSLEPCWDLGLGRQQGTGEGYVGSNTQSRWWLTTGPSLTFSHKLAGGLRATITAGMAARLYKQPFSIVDMGSPSAVAVQMQEPVGEYLGLGLTATWPTAAETSGW